jgi:hypothetical protein
MAKNSKCTGREKTPDKRDIKFLSFKSFKPTYQHLAAFVFVSFCFWGEVYNM